VARSNRGARRDRKLKATVGTTFVPTAVDLFAGCGGISEGFVNAGFRVAAFLECDHHAVETLRTRAAFHGLRELNRLPWYARYFREEISREALFQKFPGVADDVEASVIEREFGEDRYIDIICAIRNALKLQGVDKVNVLIGGPPCQAYSLVGRSRDPNRMENDGRHFLYEHYLHVLEDLRPDFFVLENVPGLLSAKTGGQDMFQKMLADFAAIEPAYEVAPSYSEYSQKPRDHLVNSSWYGVPQTRVRVILIGYRRALARTHPKIKAVFKQLLANKCRVVLTVTDAIGDLPELNPGDGKDGWFGSYEPKSLTKYQSWAHRQSAGVCNHKARTHMPSDLDRYRFFIDHHLNGNQRATLHDLLDERPDLTPQHDHLDKFIDRFKVQLWNRPSATVMAHIAKDGHYYIHPDVHQCRSFTVREAARCQSFPDNFRFEGPRTEQFKQVGNAVPPRMAQAIAKVLLQELKEIYRGA
jgi:DNA (cytosine-5)-methyltransferase 1